MSDKDWVLNDDGSRYAVFLQVPDNPNEQYGIDLVRHAQDEHGLLREQRLTLAQYNSYGEAEEHFYEAEQQMQDTGLEDFDVDTLATMPYIDTPTILPAQFPPDADGGELATTNILVIAEDGIQASKLAEGDIETQASLVAQLDLVQIEEGDDRLLDEAMELAEVEGQHAPATPLFAQQDVETPADLLPFAMDNNLRPYDASGNAIPHLVDDVNTTHWFGIVERDNDAIFSHELRYFRAQPDDTGDMLHDSHPIMPLVDGERETAWILPELESQLQRGELFEAQELASETAFFYGQDFPETLDLVGLKPQPKYYVVYGLGQNDLPSLEIEKTWVDGVKRNFDTLTVGEYSSIDEMDIAENELQGVLKTQGLEAAMNLAENMAVAGGYLDPERDDPRIFFEDDAPADPFLTNRERDLAEPFYSIAAISANGESFLDVYKEWGEDDYERLVVPQPTWEEARDKAMDAHEMMDEGRLEDAMHLVELEAMRMGIIDGDRLDPRLFTQGPPDTFETLAERLQDEPNPFWNTDGEVIEDLDPGVESTVENPYWRLDSLPVHDPDGEPLGHALHIVVYPDVADGMHEEIEEGTPFQMMEMAHFEKEQEMENFSKDFWNYLMPGVLEGPELATEVARLEGLPAEYRTLDGQELEDYRNAELTLTRTPEQWHPYNPNAERDARLKAEGMYTDPIYVYDQTEQDEKTLTVPDFDL